MRFFAQLWFSRAHRAGTWLLVRVNFDDLLVIIISIIQFVIEMIGQIIITIMEVIFKIPVAETVKEHSRKTDWWFLALNYIACFFLINKIVCIVVVVVLFVLVVLLAYWFFALLSSAHSTIWPKYEFPGLKPHRA